MSVNTRIYKNITSIGKFFFLKILLLVIINKSKKNDYTKKYFYSSSKSLFLEYLFFQKKITYRTYVMYFIRFFCIIVFLTRRYFVSSARSALENYLRMTSFVNSFKDSGLYDTIILLILERYYVLFVRSVLFFSNFLMYEKASGQFFLSVSFIKNYLNISNFNFFFFLKNMLYALIVPIIIFFLFA